MKRRRIEWGIGMGAILIPSHCIFSRRSAKASPVSISLSPLTSLGSGTSPYPVPLNSNRIGDFLLEEMRATRWMQELCIGEMRHDAPASLPFWTGALCTFSRSLRGNFWWGWLAIHRNRHLTFVANWLPGPRGRHLILLSWAFIYHL